MGLPDGFLQNSFDATLSPCPFPGYVWSVYSNALIVPNRKALFDLSIAGPLAGFVVTLPLLIWGLAFYCRSAAAAGRLLMPLNPNYSFLVALLRSTQLTGNKQLTFIRSR